jgi:hypothetical protein
MHSFILKREFISNEGTLYEVLRTLKEDQTPENEQREAWKQLLEADIIFRRDGHLYFCRTIQEAEIINDEPKDSDGTI